MPIGLLPAPAPAHLDAGDLTDPQAVVEEFLAALADTDLDRALALVDEDVQYTNVGLPTVHGRTRLEKVFRSAERPEAGFEVYLHAITADGPIVLTERTDVLLFGRFRAQFWVCGRFDVHDGKITLWRDAFDFVDLARGTVRAVIGLVVPSLRPKAPTSLDAPPGR